MLCRTIVLLLAITIGAGRGAAADDEAAKKRAEEVAAQIKLAEEQWKKHIGERAFVKKETDNFLVYGHSSFAEKDIEAIALTADKQLAQLKKTLAIKAEDQLWPGKLIIHVFKERGPFSVFVRSVEKMSPEKDDTAFYAHKSDHTYIIAGPAGSGGKSYPPDVEVVRALASATLTKKSGRLQEWFVSGFGRATAYRYAPMQFAAERQTAINLVKSGKTARHVWGNMLSGSEALVLNASFMDFLAYGPWTKQWPAILAAMGEETMFDEVLKEAKLNPAQIEYGWPRWAVQGGK